MGTPAAFFYDLPEHSGPPPALKIAHVTTAVAAAEAPKPVATLRAGGGDAVGRFALLHQPTPPPSI